jgi:hypothetical protein
MFGSQAAGIVVSVAGEVECGIENRCGFTIVVVGITRNPTDRINDRFLTV